MTTQADYAFMSAYIYNNASSTTNKIIVKSEWLEIKYTNETTLSGFTAGAYKNTSTGEIVVAYKGTDTIDPVSAAQDWIANIGSATGLGALQIVEAARFYLEVKNANPDADISFTGHSLGGGLASIMAVWFDRPATVFDEAPFQLGALNLVQTLPSSFQDAALGIFQATLGTALLARESNVTHYFIAGEALEYLRAGFDTIAEQETPLSVGGGGQVGAINLHSMKLLATLMINNQLAQDTRDLPDLMKWLFPHATNPYAHEPLSNKRDFLTFLLNDQISKGYDNPNGLLNRFAHDVSTLAAGTDLASSQQIVELLTRLGIDHYYSMTNGFSQELFQRTVGGVQFDLNACQADLTNILPYADLRDWALQQVGGDPDAQRAAIPYFTEKQRWTVALESTTALNGTAPWDTQGNIVLGGNLNDRYDAGPDNDLLLGNDGNDDLKGNPGNDVLQGGGGIDWLDGGDGDDVLAGGSNGDLLTGGAGNDTLNGYDGAGGDSLEGGAGFDSYQADAGDTILDTDNQGEVWFNGIKLGFASRVPSTGEWIDSAGNIFTLNGSTLQINNQLTIEGFSNRALGIYLDDPNPTPPGPGPGGSGTGASSGASSRPWLSYSPSAASSLSIQTVRWDPLVFDLDGNGQIDTVSSTASTAYFDFNGDGIAEKSGWIAAQDGILALDANNNGAIDNLNELFGSNLQDGFTELRTLDIQHDGVINALDTDFARLLVWQDKSQDGIAQTGELSTLENLGITQINLATTSVDIPAADNLITVVGSFVRNGQSQLAADILLKVIFSQTDANPLRPLDLIPALDAEVFNLPWLRGYGLVKSLHLAYQENPSLQLAAQSLVSQGRDHILNNFDGFLAKWTGLAAAHLAHGVTRIQLTVEDKVWMLETLTGQNASKNIIETANFASITPGARVILSVADRLLTFADITWNVTYIENQYQAFAKRAAISFVMQAEADDWLPGAYYSLGQDRFVALDAARLQTHLQERLAAITHPEDANFGALVLARLTSDGVDLAPETMKAALAESPYSSLYSLALDFTGSHVWLLTGNQAAFSAYGNEDWFVLGTPASENLAGGGGEDVLIGAAGNDTLAGNAMADILSGGDGSDVLYGNDDDDVLNGGTGTDSLYGLDGNDVLNGDAGNDWLSGGNGADVYLFYRGSGRDVIDNADSDAPGSNADIVQLGADIAPDDVTLRREGSVLLLDINGSTDRLILSGYFYVNNVTNSALETIQFVDGALWDIATVKAKVLIGGSGNDILSGYASADTLDGGPGNDTLSGDMGADIFLFNRGHGQDTITDYSSNALNGNTDGIQLGTNIAPGDVTLSRVNGDLLLGINNSSDMLWLNGYFASYTASNNALTAIQFADGTVWDNATVKAKVLIGGSGNDTLTGYATADSLFGGTGNDVLYGGDDADVLDGETGNDTLKGEKGADVLLGGAGNDTLDGGNDRDTLDGGSGNDSLYGSHGADVYRFGRGSGHDTIDNFDWDLPGRNADAIQLEDGIVPADVTISRSVNDLLLQISGSDATLWVPRYFELEATTVYAVETIQFTDGTVWNIAAVKAKMLVGGDDYDYFKGYATADILLGGNGGDTLFGGEGADQINGDAGADYLHGENGADTLMGGTGKDILSGGNDNDLLDGGTGNDTLYAGYGADIYLFDRGSGQDTIYNSGSVIVDGKADSIHLGTGIAIHDVTLGRSGNDLLLKITGSDDSLRVQSYFPANGASNHSLETIQFADGTLWDTATIDARALIGDSGSNTLTGYAGADTLNGGDGGDMLYGADGADVLMGGAGKDALYGDNGNDTLDSGAGNDTLRGGDGADVYWFGRGSHQDTLDNADNDVYGSNADTLQLGADLAVGDMLVSRIGDDLLLGIDGTLDLLRVQNYFYQDGASNSGLEAIQFADGTRWDFPTVKTQALTATLGNDVLIGFASADTVAAYDGNDGVYGRDGMDVLDGGSGADTLYGENGADLLTGAVGSDALYGGNDSDTLDGGAGSDLLGGDSGADVYLFGRGAGRDAINNYDGDALGGYVDAIKLGAGIAAADVTLTRVGDDLNLQLKSTDDALLVRNYFYLDGTSAYGLEFIQFADGTVWNYVTAKGKLTTATSTASKTLSGTKKSEKLTGGAGNDLAYGYGGNDTVDGAAGNDTLDGGIGNDIYLFGKGSGKDVINSFDTTVGKKDTILLGAGITAADILPGRNADALVLTITSTGDSIRVNNYFVNDGAGGYQIELVKFADGSSWNVAAVKALALLGTGENDNLTGYAGADTISGLSGDDTLYARAGDDTLYGTAGNDRLYGEDGSDNLQGGTQSDTLSGGNGIDNLQGQEGSDSLYGDVGDDLLDGGAHSDTLDGGPGNDTYLFGRGSGQDTLNSLDNAIGKLDKIQLGTGIAMADVQLGRDNNDLLLAIKGTADGLRVANYLFIEAGGGYQVERIQFADGGLWDIAAIKAKLLEGGNENDTLIGYAGADTLAGAAGNDSLIGGTGDDVLDAGSGNDTLDGGIGNDIYLFGLGAGKDIINNVDNTAGKLDSIQLGDGTSAANVALSRSGNDLWLRINGTTDSLCISNYFVNEAASGFRVEQIRFADGTAWDVAAVKIQVLTGGDEDDALMGYLSSDSISGLAGNDTIKSGVGDDWVDGGDGYDSLYGEDGDDSLLGGKQHDQLWGGNGADTLQEQSGNNQLYGENGNDTLAGGTGMDGLFGGNGADVYRFGRGSGMDTIYNNDTDALGSNADSIWLNAGITAGDLTLSHSNNDLKIQIYGTNDQLVVANYFSMDTTVNYALETIQFADGVVWDMAAVKARLLSPTDGADALVGFAAADSIGGGAGNDRLYGRDGADTLEGDAGSDALYGENGTDLLYGGADNDTLYGGNEGDTLEGGAGNDSLNGDNGADVYLFGRDAGQDTINNSESDVPGVSSDTIQLVGDLAPGDISLARSNDDLLIQINGSDDLLKVSWYFSNWGNSNYLVDNIQFADGMVWNMYSVKDKLSIGTTGNDTIKGFITADTITGGDGNDIITDSNGSDIIDGGTGDDIITDQGGGANTLSGGDGDDIITFSYIANNTIEGGSGHDLIKTDYYGAGYSNIFAGGKGNDRVQSSSNGDTYLFSRGDGQDTINDHSYGNAAADKLVFGAATSSNPPIAFDQLWFRHTGDHLEVTVIGEPDSIVIENWYLGTIYHIEQFQTQDGKTLLDSQVENLVLAMADFALPTETILPQDYQDTLAPILAANWW